MHERVAIGDTRQWVVCTDCHTRCLLDVLVAGGEGIGLLASAELYDPGSGT
jgi:hypothetical protein